MRYNVVVNETVVHLGVPGEVEHEYLGKGQAVRVMCLHETVLMDDFLTPHRAGFMKCALFTTVTRSYYLDTIVSGSIYCLCSSPELLGRLLVTMNT